MDSIQREVLSPHACHIYFLTAVTIILEVTRRFEANHPEILRRAFVVNASRIFHMLFNMLRPLLHQRTMAKIKIFSTNRREWVSALLEDIDQDQLPKHFGGSGRTGIQIYQKNEKWFSTLPVQATPLAISKSDTIEIEPKGKAVLHFDITVPNSKVREYEFRADHYDIEFSLYRENLESDPEVKYDRYPSHLMTVEGEVTCKIPAKYIAEFNNSYSKHLCSKTLHYHFCVIEPKPRKIQNVEMVEELQ